jgi:subtilisin family serine protease
LSKHYTFAGTVGNGIDASVTATWRDSLGNVVGFRPIGNPQNPFTGSFDGLALGISNLTIKPVANTVTHIGLFGLIGPGGVIKDLEINNASITANPNVGLAQQAIGVLAGVNTGTVTNVHATGTILGGPVNNLDIGGLVGRNGNFNGLNVVQGLVLASSADVDITAGGVNIHAGGLVGTNVGSINDLQNSSQIDDSRAGGDITLNGNASACGPFISCQYLVAGGLVGFNQGYIDGNVAPVVDVTPKLGTGVWASGAVHVGSHGVAGGLVGQNDGKILNTLATGAVTGAAGSPGPDPNDQRETTLGGLVGRNSGEISLSKSTGADVGSGGVPYLLVGGLVGRNQGVIILSSSSRNVRAGDHSMAGGLAGNSEAADFFCNNCILGVGFDPIVSGQILASDATGNVLVGAASVAGGLAGTAAQVLGGSASGNVIGGDNSVLGGLVGAIDNEGFIFGATANGNVTSTGPNSWIGGLIGLNAGVVANSTANGVTTGNGNSIVGGLAAVNIGTITAIFGPPSSATGDVNGNGANNILGGLVGVNFGTIMNSTSAGDVTGGANNIVGGLVGANLALDVDVQVPIPSSFPVGTIIGSTATGAVSGGPGSIVGAQVGVSNVDTIPLPSVLGTCHEDFCKLILDGKLKVEDLPPPVIDQIVPDNILANVQQQFQTVVDKTDQNQNQVVQTLIQLTSAPASPPASSGNQQSSSSSSGQTGGRGAAPPPRELRPVTGPEGERFSGVPPLNETRFFNNEVILQIGTNIPPEQIAAVTQRLGLTVIASQTLGSIGRTAFRFQIGGGRSVRDVIRALEANSIVASAQPNYRFTLAQQTAAIPPEGNRRGDPSQYMMSKLHLDAVHRMVGGKDVTIAVIDSEVDGEHSELAGAIADRYATVGEKEKAHSHGTAMAGAISARDRLLGVAPSAKILAIRAFSESENSADGTSFNIIRAIDWAVSQGARVINMSFAGPFDPSLARALKSAHDKGVVLIAAAGNAGPKAPPLWPAGDPHVIAVTATDAQDRLFRQANRGNHVTVAAPGVDILAAAPEAAYQLSTGTSIATAHVSGVVALMLERDPNLTPEAVRQVLESTATDLGPKGRDAQFGWGLINPEKALQAVTLRAKGADASQGRPDTVGSAGAAR